MERDKEMSDDTLVLLKAWAKNTNDGMQKAVLVNAAKEITSLRKLVKQDSRSTKKNAK
jgi:hypothetical protein